MRAESERAVWCSACMDAKATQAFSECGHVSVGSLRRFLSKSERRVSMSSQSLRTLKRNGTCFMEFAAGSAQVSEVFPGRKLRGQRFC